MAPRWRQSKFTEHGLLNSVKHNKLTNKWSRCTTTECTCDKNTMEAARLSPPPSNSGAQRRRGGPRVNRFVFTLNNYNQQEEEALKNFECKWMIFGHEVGDNGTPHLQGAVCIGKSVAFSTIKRYYSFTRAHIEPMHGTPQQSRDYCTKQDKDKYFEKGSMPAPGTRSDLIDLAAKVTAGATMRDLAKTDPEALIKYHRGLTALRRYTTKCRDVETPPTVIWIYGPTGTGKTMWAVRTAIRLFGSDMYWMSSGTLQWFDGYDGQPCVILDDIRTKHAEFSYLLRLLDRYPIKVPIKGDFAEWIPKLIFVTCPWDPREMWHLRTPEQLDQLSRRVGYIIQAPDGIERLSAMCFGSGGEILVPELQDRRDVSRSVSRDGRERGDGEQRELLSLDELDRRILTCDEEMDEVTREFLEACDQVFDK